MRIFLTGGTGSLGQALLATAKRENWDAEITVFSRDEFKQSELRPKYPEYSFILGDIRNEDWLRVVMAHHDTVIHTAAYKHVPQSESNVAEAVDVNVIGSRNIARVAVELGVKRVLAISTDKACAPINTYGMTKALMEKLFAHATLWGETQFNCVRYGNVLGSRGSVLPIFREQQEKQGFVTVTDPHMTRFWLTLADAVELIKRGLQEIVPGAVIVPKTRSCDMETFVQAAVPGCTIKVVGIRPGERIHERLIHKGEAMNCDDLGFWFRIHPAYTGYIGDLDPDFEYTSDMADRIGEAELRSMIGAVA